MKKFFKKKYKKYYLYRIFSKIRQQYRLKFYLKIYRLFTKKTIVHYIHISKTGGTAIQHALRKGAAKPVVTPTYVLFVHGHEFTLDQARDGEKVVFFVRDPVNRFVSRYYQRKKGENNPAKKENWSELDHYIYEKYETVQAFVDALIEDPKKFYTFKELTNTYERWLGTPEFVEEKIADGTVCFVGEQEHFFEDFERMKQKFMLSDEFELPLRTDVKKSNVMPASYDTTLTVEAKKKMESYFYTEYRIMNMLREHTLIR